jgi:hypothetical protein
MRLPQKVRARAASVLVLLVATAMVVAVTAALGGARSDLLPRYQYAGVVENDRGAPAHWIAAGDGFRFVFFDALSQGLRSERYKICVGRAGKAPVRCWSRTARYGLGRLVYTVKLPSNVPFGQLRARWLVNGRVVAIWPFLYIRGGG